MGANLKTVYRPAAYAVDIIDSFQSLVYNSYKYCICDINHILYHWCKLFSS